jgi:hypothetical protein
MDGYARVTRITLKKKILKTQSSSIIVLDDESGKINDT